MLHMHSQLRILAALAIAFAAAAGASKRPITETDLYAFRWIAAPQISPDGTKIVYTMVTVNSKHDNVAAARAVLAGGEGAPDGGPRAKQMKELV